MSEVKPKFAPKIQKVWDNCETYIDSVTPEAAAGELEFFVEQLIESLVKDKLAKMGYINERR